MDGTAAAQEFNALYAGRIQPAVQALEVRRILTFVAAGAIFLLSCMVGSQIARGLAQFPPLAGVGVWFVFAGFLAGGGGAAWLIWRTHKALPGLLMQAIAAPFGLTWRMSGAMLALSQFTALGLAVPAGQRELKGVLAGEADGRVFEIALVQDTTGLGQARFTTFQGFLMSTPYGRAFPATVVILHEGWGGAPGSLEAVGLVDSRFERRFRVFSDDQVESRVLLDPVAIEALFQADQFVGGQRLQVAFAAGAVMAAIKTLSLPSGKDAWPRLFSSVNKPEWVRALAWDLFMAMRLARDLKPAEAWIR